MIKQASTICWYVAIKAFWIAINAGAGLPGSQAPRHCLEFTSDDPQESVSDLSRWTGACLIPGVGIWEKPSPSGSAGRTLNLNASDHGVPSLCRNTLDRPRVLPQGFKMSFSPPCLLTAEHGWLDQTPVAVRSLPFQSLQQGVERRRQLLETFDAGALCMQEKEGEARLARLTIRIDNSAHASPPPSGLTRAFLVARLTPCALH